MKILGKKRQNIEHDRQKPEGRWKIIGQGRLFEGKYSCKLKTHLPSYISKPFQCLSPSPTPRVKILFWWCSKHNNKMKHCNSISSMFFRSLEFILLSIFTYNLLSYSKVFYICLIKPLFSTSAFREDVNWLMEIK